MVINYNIGLWLFIGLICISIEFAKLPGIGFLFLGLGALSNAILIYYYPSLVTDQYAYFGLLSLLCLIILWYPLKKFSKNKASLSGYNDMIGNEVVAISQQLLPGELGQVRWSGTILNAKLDIAELEASSGDKLFIKRMEGNIAIIGRGL